MNQMSLFRADKKVGLKESEYQIPKLKPEEARIFYSVHRILFPSFII